MVYPVHPAIVHFPIAAWTPTPILDAVAIATLRPSLERLSADLVLVGLVTAVVALAAGVLDAIRGRPGPAAKADLSAHVLAMSCAVSAFALGALVEPGVTESGAALSAWMRLGLNGAGAMVLLIGGHLGARLVHQHRLPNPLE